MTGALIVVDVQNLFVDTVGRGVVGEVNRCVGEAADRDWPIFYTRDIQPAAHVAEDQIALHPDLDVRGAVIDKGPGRVGGYSGFVLLGERTGGLSALAESLRRAGADSVKVVGIAADVCVSATAVDAVRLGFAARVPLAATAFVHAHPAGDDAAVADLRAAGVTVS